MTTVETMMTAIMMIATVTVTVTGLQPIVVAKSNLLLLFCYNQEEHRIGTINSNNNLNLYQNKVDLLVNHQQSK